MIYSFEDFELDTDYLELRKSGEQLKIEPQVYSLLELLISNHHRVVSKDEINQHVWAGRIVSEATVNSRIRSARLAIDDNGTTQRFIRTTHNRGFRFIGNPVSSEYVETQVRAEETVEQSKSGEDSDQHGRPSIAILPLQLLNNDHQYQIFADAISHELIVELSRLHWLHIIARGSSFRFKGANADVSAIGKLLNVHYVLTGSLSIAANMGVCTVELHDTSDGQVIWADEFEGPIEDLLVLRSKIVPRIVAIVETQIQTNEISTSDTISTENLDAWAAYHRGLWHMYRFNQHDNAISENLFKRAIKLDPKFSRAHSGLSFAHFQNAFIGFTPDHDEQCNLARVHAEIGFELDPFDPFANLTMGRVAMLFGDFESSISWFDRSLEYRPSYAFAIYNRGLVDAVLGNGVDSQRLSMKAISLSPLDPLLYAMLCCRGLSHVVRKEYSEASDWAERGAIRPNSHLHIWAIAAMSHELAGNTEKARKWVMKINEAEPKFENTQFFQSFPIRDIGTKLITKESLIRLGF
jgi:TolB-like protein/tetratricopeptide (TPR) repeat protein